MPFFTKPKFRVIICTSVNDLCDFFKGKENLTIEYDSDDVYENVIGIVICMLYFELIREHSELRYKSGVHPIYVYCTSFYL